jgi:hypothetical protein
MGRRTYELTVRLGTRPKGPIAAEQRPIIAHGFSTVGKGLKITPSPVRDDRNATGHLSVTREILNTRNAVTFENFRLRAPGEGDVNLRTDFSNAEWMLVDWSALEVPAGEKKHQSCKCAHGQETPQGSPRA